MTSWYISISSDISKTVYTVILYLLKNIVYTLLSCMIKLLFTLCIKYRALAIY